MPGRIALGIEYDGSGFLGWQRQSKESPAAATADQPGTVQAVMEQAIGWVADHPVTLVCAGRTDTGVHATGQVAHFETRAQREARSWVLGANSRLPPGVAVLWAQGVPDNFHARFSAFARSYRYVILNRSVRPALEAGRVSWQRLPLDAERMHEAAQYLQGEHDFSAFRSAGCSANHPVRTVLSIGVSRQGERVLLDITANAFLYHMVRNIAGSLMEIGLGKQPPDWMAALLRGRDRRLAGVTASAAGLYFLGARYPDNFQIPYPAAHNSGTDHPGASGQ